MSEGKPEIKKDGDVEYQYTNEITCPYCGYEFGDSWEASEGEKECPDCDRKFDVERDVDVTYISYRQCYCNELAEVDKPCDVCKNRRKP
jgi:hypothetical protein